MDARGCPEERLGLARCHRDGLHPGQRGAEGHGDQARIGHRGGGRRAAVERGGRGRRADPDVEQRPAVGPGAGEEADVRTGSVDVAVTVVAVVATVEVVEPAATETRPVVETAWAPSSVRRPPSETPPTGMVGDMPNTPCRVVTTGVPLWMTWKRRPPAPRPADPTEPVASDDGNPLSSTAGIGRPAPGGEREHPGERRGKSREGRGPARLREVLAHPGWAAVADCDDEQVGSSWPTPSPWPSGWRLRTPRNRRRPPGSPPP